MNLFSVAAGAAAVGVVTLLGARLLRSRWAGVAAGLLFAVGKTYWYQAVITEVYTFQTLLVCSTLLAVLDWDAGQGRSRLRWGAFLYGLCFTNHLMSVVLAPAGAYLVASSRRRSEFRTELPYLIPLFCLALLAYLYLPLAAWRIPVVNWSDPVTLPNFLYHVTGRQYGNLMFSGGLSGALLRAGEYAGLAGPAHPSHLPTQYGLPALGLAVLGTLSLARNRRRWLIFTALWFGAVVGVGVNYNIRDIDAYFIGSYVVLALWAAAGLRFVLGLGLLLLRRRGQTRRVVRPRVAAAVLILLLTSPPLFANWAVNDRNADNRALPLARATLESLAPNALLIAGGDNSLPAVQYARYVEGRRPDVAVADFMDLLIPARSRSLQRLSEQGIVVRLPAGYREARNRYAARIELLRQIVEDNLDRRPIYVLGIPVDDLASGPMQAALGAFAGHTGSNLAWVRLLRRQPPLPPVPPSGRVQFRFGRPEPGGGVQPVLELLRVGATRWIRGEQTGVRLTYDWRVRDAETGRRAMVYAVFGDEQGNLDVQDVMESARHNIHALGQTPQPGHRALPELFREEFELYLPGSTPGRPLYLWLSVRVGEESLAVAGRNERFVLAGVIP